MDVRKRPVRLDTRVEKMDMELKQHFKEHRQFVVEALGGLKRELTEELGQAERGLTEQIDKTKRELTEELGKAETRLTRRIDKFAETVKSGFGAIDTRLASLQTSKRRPAARRTAGARK